MPVRKSIQAANYFLYKSNKSGKKDLTNKKLQKLLYYGQAWSLVLREEKLFPDKIEAWIHGPAIPVVFEAFKEFQFHPIERKVSDDDFPSLTNDEKEHLDMIWEVYGKYDASYLEALTHSEIPWQKARENLLDYEPSRKQISLKLMKEFYAKKLAEAKEGAETEN